MIDNLKVKGYRGNRKVYVGGVELSPGHSQSLRNHSPDGFNWSYGGSGPAQLALALLVHFSKNDEFALDHYQAFKFDMIATLPQSDFELDGNKVLNWITQRKQKEEALCNSKGKSPD